MTPSKTAAAAAAPVLVVMTVLLIVASLSELPYAREGATTAAVVATALQFTVLTRMARIFCLLAVVAAAVAIALPPERFAEVMAALWQGVSFCALLSMLGCLRSPVRRSRIVAEAAAYLACFPATRRYGAINIGSHFLSLLFNVGVIPLIGTLLKSSASQSDQSPHGQFRHMLLAGLRGSVLVTVWSPMGLGFAIATTAVVGLDPVKFLVVAFASAMLLLTVTCVAMRGEVGRVEGPKPTQGSSGSPGALATILLVSAVLLGATILLHKQLALGFIVATVLVLPVFALGWTFVEAGESAQPLRERLGALLSGIGDLRTEAAIFLSANVIGATISAFIRTQTSWGNLGSGDYPAMPVLILCLAAVPLAGAAFIPHSILVVLIAQLLGPSPLGVAHPLTLGLTLTFGWALAISVSPISAMSLMAGSLAGVPSHVVALSWNRRFALVLFAAAATIICLLSYGGL